MSKLTNQPPVNLRISSIDALRGFIIFMMIFVNDLAIIKNDIVPDWMVHFSDRIKGTGMTFVDLIFPAFIFIVGMAIPFSIRASKYRKKTQPEITIHILTRTFSLLLLGVIMANGWPSSDTMGWSAPLWQTLMGFSAILAFCEISPVDITKKNDITEKKQLTWRTITILLRIIGFIGLVILAFQYVGKQNNPIITLSPPYLDTSWWGILGILGFSYLIASIIYLIFENHRTALLGCMVLLLCLFPAAKSELLKAVWLADYINIGATLGSQPAIAVAGTLLATILMTPHSQTIRARIQFTTLFIFAMSLAAVLLNSLYGISKNQATPSWALWSCAVTASLWLFFYIICDLKPVKCIAKPCAMAGKNVLLTYLLSSLYFSFMINIGLSDDYQNIAQMGLAYAILRALSISTLLIYCTVRLNRIGFQLKL
jgi:heparan-alpha-glucosaminide N-acetyltransferase